VTFSRTFSLVLFSGPIVSGESSYNYQAQNNIAVHKMAQDKATYKEPSFIKSFTAGGVGGVALVCTGHPLDTIKVNMLP